MGSIMETTSNVLRKILFLALALIVFAGFIFPFFVVPKKYENKARAMTEERIAESGVTVEPSYIEDSVNEAVNGSLNMIFREALLIACACAVIAYCFSVRPPHDCGGFNLFNPIYLVFVAALPLLTAAAVASVMSAHGAESVTLFKQFVTDLTENGGFRTPQLLFVVMLPLALEGVFRGIIFSFLEKLHYFVAIILSALLYAAAAYIAVGAYTRWSMGTNAPAMVALCIALVVGIVNGVMTWRLRSGIPAALAHMFMAYSAPQVAEFCAKHSITPALAIGVLGAVLAVFILLPALFGKKVKVLAYDFPLTRHHECMNDWLYGRMRRRERKTEKEAGQEQPAEAPAEEKQEAPAENAQGQNDEQPAEPEEHNPAEAEEASAVEPAKEEAAEEKENTAAEDSAKEEEASPEAAEEPAQGEAGRDAEQAE